MALPGSGDLAPPIAVIGCGAIAAALHLPALARHPPVMRRLVLVDRDERRLAELADRYGIATTARDYHEVLSSVRGAIVALPYDLHFAVARDCLGHGVHVLCEKPVAETGAQLRLLAAEAAAAGVTISANNTRRLYPSFQAVAALLQSGAIGRPRRIVASWGDRFDWNPASGTYFGAGRRGVLTDWGAHVLDVVCWWLRGKPRLLAYRDDSFGGSEAVAEVALELAGCQVTVALNWLTRYENLLRVVGDDGSIEVGVHEWRSFTRVSRSGKRTRIAASTRVRTPGDFGAVLIENFLDIIRDGHTPLVPATAVEGSIDLIEECYTRRERFPMPWHDAFHRVVQ